MRHLCEHCGQKYAIPQERVTGKILKIRCQKCQGIMVVDGGSAPPQDAARPVAATDSDMPMAQTEKPQPKEWYAGVGGKPYGPYSRREVLGLVERGEVRKRTLMWKDGMEGWLRVNECDTLDWVRGAVEYREAHCDAQAPKTPTLLFEAVPPSLVTDGRSYFPDPTLHSGWSVLSEEARHYLDTVARREVEHQRNRQWARHGLNAAAFLALMLLGVAGAYAASGM